MGKLLENLGKLKPKSLKVGSLIFKKVENSKQI